MMEVKTRDGRTLSKEIRAPKGNPGNPVTMDDCIAKFKKAAKHSRKPFSADQLDEIADAAGGLEHLANVSKLTRLLTPKSAGGKGR